MKLIMIVSFHDKSEACPKPSQRDYRLASKDYTRKKIL